MNAVGTGAGTGAGTGSRPRVSAIVAMAGNGVIGRDKAMPWHLPDDLKRFKALSLGKPVLMGRKTYESIGKPLPGRKNIVLTRDATWSAPGVTVVRSLEEALSEASDVAELVIVGGAEIYRLAMPLIDVLHLTHIHATIEGDTVFPPIDVSQWRETERVEHPADERHAYAMSFSTLERQR